MSDGRFERARVGKNNVCTGAEMPNARSRSRGGTNLKPAHVSRGRRYANIRTQNAALPVKTSACLLSATCKSARSDRVSRLCTANEKHGGKRGTRQLRWRDARGAGARGRRATSDDIYTIHDVEA